MAAAVSAARDHAVSRHAPRMRVLTEVSISALHTQRGSNDIIVANTPRSKHVGGHVAAAVLLDPAWMGTPMSRVKSWNLWVLFWICFFGVRRCV